MRALILLALLAPQAHAGNGHFTLPNTAAITDDSTDDESSDDQFDLKSSTPPKGCNEEHLLSWFQNFRQKTREDFAEKVLKNHPPFPDKLARGASCIKSPVAHDVAYNESSDNFTLTCLAAKDGKLVSVFKLDLAVPVPDCMSDSSIQTWIGTHTCQFPYAAKNYLENTIKPCSLAMGYSRQLNTLLSSPAAFEVDKAAYQQLVEDRPDVKNIVDRNLHVVGAPVYKESNGTKECKNPLGCKQIQFQTHDSDEDEEIAPAD